MRHLLVTGGCGFIGANFIRFVLDESDFNGCIINVDKLTYAGNPENLADRVEAWGPRYRFIQADIVDRPAMEKIFAELAIDSVCHFAAESHVDRSIVAPDAFVQTNIVGTHVLLDICRQRSPAIQRFHHVSTDEVYGDLGREGYFTESTAYRPSSPYSASKAASDHLVRAFQRTYGLPVTICNCSNNYGPYQFPEKLIPLMVLNALDGKPLPVYGDGAQVRDWLFVRDHCRALWQVMTQGRRGETYNVGGNCEMANLQVVEMVCDLVDEMAPRSPAGPRRDLITFVTDRPGHDRRYAIDCAKIQSELGWQPEESFATGLRKTVQWYLGHRAWVARIQSGAYREWIASHYGIRDEG